MLDRLIKLLELTGNEAKYFRAIVGYGQPATCNEKEYWFEQAIQQNNTPQKIIDKKPMPISGSGITPLYALT